MNILHLSDIHFGRNDARYGIGDTFTKHDEILDQLIETVAKIDSHLRPEHIVFTGDIAWHGKSAEYHEALNWFKRLLSTLDLTGRDISFCVGNHDLDLACDCENVVLDNDSVDVIDRAYRYENIHLMEAPLYGYNEFCREIGMEPYCYPLNGEMKYSYSVGYKDVHFSNSKTVRLLALNTAMLLPCEGISEDKMWLGQEQIKAMIGHGILPAPKDVWYTITLCHHSDRFLHPDETSTYNGRPATLPLLLEHVNLVLCGHTESSGKPRLSKHPGGGNILCGGAAYYSDDHINAFSMIYLSERKRTMGFLPYVYENGWQDYDFEHSFIRKGQYDICHDEEDILQGVTFLFESGTDSFSIPCQYLKFRHYQENGNRYVRFDNHKDLMNPFCIEYDSASAYNAPVHVTLASTVKFSAAANLAYKQYAAFAGKNESLDDTVCRIVAADGKEIFSTGSFSAMDQCRYDEQFLKDILQLENTFRVRFSLPDAITKSDLKKMRLLKKLSATGYMENAVLSGEVKKAMSHQELQAIYDSACRNNTFCIKSNQPFRFHLFGVTLELGSITVYASSFYVDLNDLSHKLKTFRDGDFRVCTFIPDIDLNVCLVRDLGYKELVNSSIIPADAEMLDIESIELTIDI